MSVKNPRESGFAIVELLVTLIVIGIVFGAFIVTFTSIQNINKHALDISKANEFGFGKVQEYENMDFDDITATSPAGTLVEVEDFSSDLPGSLQTPRVGKVYVNTATPTLKQVVVSIEFGSGDTAKELQYADFIQKYGQGR
jgi:type II secretory pathway pseudopilin PulG